MLSCCTVPGSRPPPSPPHAALHIHPAVIMMNHQCEREKAFLSGGLCRPACLQVLHHTAWSRLGREPPGAAWPAPKWKGNVGGK